MKTMKICENSDDDEASGKPSYFQEKLTLLARFSFCQNYYDDDDNDCGGGCYRDEYEDYD